MARRVVVLVNSNEMRPPVAPLALDYIGDGLAEAGFRVVLVDLSWDERPLSRLEQALAGLDPLAVGISFRNTDDCFLPSGAWFVPRLRDIVSAVRRATAAPIVLGGCGFSIFPVVLLEYCEADLAIVGDGERAFRELLDALAAERGSHEVAGLVHRDPAGRITANPPRYDADLSVPTRRGTIDNARYFREGGMGNVETKRGCPRPCLYCADPVAKGRAVRCRSPREVADEFESLRRQDVDVLHLCDGEFNIPPHHALAVCEELIARGLGEQVRWYGYATVDPFSEELASAMRRAGCVGLNFGVDSACDRMLAVLRRGYRRSAIADAVRWCRRAGIAVMLDLLIGGPGEDEESVAESIAFLKTLDPDRVGAATGIRVYPHTGLAEQVRRQGPMAGNPHLHGQREDNEDFLRPVFYLDRRLGERPLDLVVDLIAGDERFFPPPRTQDAANYNYNDNRVLQEAIRSGHRGAFWDILRRLDRS